MGKRTDVCFPDDGPLRVKVQSNVRRFGRQTKIIKGSFQSKAASNIFYSSVEMNRSVLFFQTGLPKWTRLIKNRSHVAGSNPDAAWLNILNFCKLRHSNELPNILKKTITNSVRIQIRQKH